MVSVLGAVWGTRHRLRRRHRVYRAQSARPSARAISSLGPWQEPQAAPGRHRVRRFDYDRFYLRMLRDL
jgi:hypothetical protein